MLKITRTPAGVLLAALLLWAGALPASPVGTFYKPELLIVVPPGGFAGIAEAHAPPGPVPFDFTVKPAPEFIPGTGSAVTIMEMFTVGPGFEVIEFWWKNITPGAPLFDLPLGPDQEIFSVIDGLHWGAGSPGAVASVVDVTLTFPTAPALHLTPGAEYEHSLFGAGTESDPLLVDVGVFDIAGLLASHGIGEPITDLHITLHVTHIPLPAALPLLAAAVFAVFGLAGRPRA